MVEVIGGAFLVALIWLITYGMSATDSQHEGVSMPHNEASSTTKRAA
jgi:hypothetical protein